LTTAAQGIALGSKSCTHKWLDHGKRLLQGEVCVFPAAMHRAHHCMTNLLIGNNPPKKWFSETGFTNELVQ